MANKKEENFRDVLFEEALSGVKSDIRLTLILLTFFSFLALFIKFILGIPLSLVVFILLFIWILLYLSHNYFVQSKKDRKELGNFHFKNSIVDILLLTVIIHYLGGVEWIGAIFYLAILARTSNVLSKKQSLILVFSAIFFYSTLVLLEYFQFLPHREIFGPSPGFYRDPAYIVIQILSLIAIFFFIVENYGNFSEAFRKKQEKLVQTQKEIEEGRSVLEIKVQARTRELKDLAESLEEQVGQRTKELQEKIEELEKFNRLAMGRELKMMELKEEIQKLKEELEKYKDRQ
jgi:hypothetical protein